ncbi:LCCL domain-containing protein [Crucibulum laeve]|uniref:LCCL domain-containing protein n=1 Tax=Crucibulum laeve TaxID=68775 RepID=A0A5C3M6V3_9AGAR|nr:LCCL domain-containing protein [Crucibulum laeve]
MAVPSEFTILDLTGKFTMNKALTDPRTDDILAMQGVGWWKRKAISLGTITLFVKHFKDDAGVEHIDIDQTITGGIPGTSEQRTLTWTERENEDHLFGPVLAKSRRVKVDELEEEFLKVGWTPDTLEHGVVQAYAESNTPKSGKTWIANQTWGIGEINGERRYIRHLKFTGPKGEDIEAPLVYDYPPMPILNIDRHIHGRHVHIPIESNLIRLVRPFTNPWLLALLGVAYIISFAFFTRAQSFITAADSFIGCTATYWLANDGCGLNGQLCAPFDNSTFEFRCPAQCNNVILQNPRTVGNEEIAFKPLVVGGGDPNGTYRGDSFICAAAIQAGVITHSKGGCGALQLDGNFTNFVPFTNNGITSLGFPTVFPLSFSFLQGTTLDHCEDMRDGALAFNALICCLAFILLQSRPLALFWSLVCIGFWHVALFSQPQGPPPKLDVAFGTFLPVLFIAYGFWRLAVRFTFPAFSCAPLEASIWFLGPFWVSLLNNLTFDKLPLSRLTASDLGKRAGAITSLVVILCVVVVLVINQVRVIRKTGWLPHYLGWYILGGLVILVLALLPGLNLRLHHYILGMVIIPGTAFPTRLSLAYQGLCLGLFLNGAAAFGLDPILQTAADLRQDAALGSLLPSFLTNSTNYNNSIPFVDQTITWDMIPNSDWDGFALLVDDVQRYAGTALNFSLAAFDSNVPHFFRLAFTSGAQAGDFTKPATLWPNGTWINPLPGPS